MTDARLVSINELADRTGLPVAWLRREAEAGRIPSTQAGRRRFFDTAAVLKALANRHDAGKAVARD
jgi:excisionase family DNA binding protein